MPPVRAAEGIVHVWRADLTAVGGELEELLCAEELTRAARIVPARKRVLWARSRGVLRALLGRYLERDPRELRFVLGPHGKPALRERAGLTAEEPGRMGPGGDLRFNLSHSGTLALYAVTAAHEVGIDLEHARERYTAEFLHTWVAREAAVKCRGTGLASPSSQGPPAAELWTAALNVGPQATAAVAIEGGRCELRCYPWW